jgi:hypothetical protein
MPSLGKSADAKKGFAFGKKASAPAHAKAKSGR